VLRNEVKNTKPPRSLSILTVSDAISTFIPALAYEGDKDVIGSHTFRTRDCCFKYYMDILIYMPTNMIMN
jgi:hypothetical protein